MRSIGWCLALAVLVGYTVVMRSPHYVAAQGPTPVTASTGTFVNLKDTGITLIKRLKVNQGTAYSGADAAIALSAGWGSTRTVTSGGYDQNLYIGVTAGGSGIAPNPTITVIFKDGTWNIAPVYVVLRNDLSSPYGAPPHTWSTNATALTITFNGTPVSGNVYIFVCMTIGR